MKSKITICAEHKKYSRFHLTFQYFNMFSEQFNFFPLTLLSYKIRKIEQDEQYRIQ